MANNRLWLVNDSTGEKTLIAKYYPSNGWCIFNEEFNTYFEGAMLNQVVENTPSYLLHLEYDHEV